jgi:branched-chain amino acid transport system permease protein
VGAGSGMVAPIYPGEANEQGLFYYYTFFVLAVIWFFTLKQLYSSRFGLAINAIRDDEDKAEAMGIHTTRYKTVA